ncbi:MAG: hypothetical protein AAGI07_02705 [Bacteroidota bacterium]
MISKNQFLKVNAKILARRKVSFRKMAVVVLPTLLVAYACTYETIPTPENCDDLPEVQILEVSNSSCGEAGGVITVDASGGEAPYTFSLDNTNFQTVGNFTSLPAGTYTITVKDNKACTSTSEVVIENEGGLNIEVTSNNSSCTSNTGSIVMTTTSGSAPFQFRLDNGQFQTGNSFNNLAPGTYNITVKDATDCEISQEVVVQADIAFGTVNSIVSTNCAVSGCHNGTIAPDLRTAATIKDRGSRIKARTSAKTMPPASSGRTLNDEEIAQIACWVDSGADITE